MSKTNFTLAGEPGAPQGDCNCSKCKLGLETGTDNWNERWIPGRELRRGRGAGGTGISGNSELGTTTPYTAPHNSHESLKLDH